MGDFAWLAEIVFFGSYFIAWCLGAFRDALSTAANTWVAVSSISALVIAVLLLVFNVYSHRNRIVQ